MRSISTCIESYEASRERPPTAGAMSMIPRAATCSRWTEDPSVSRTSFAASREPLLMRLSSRERLLAFPRQSFDHLLVSSASWRQSRAPRSCAPRPPHIWGTNAKAKRELGLVHRPFEEGFRDVLLQQMDALHLPRPG